MSIQTAGTDFFRNGLLIESAANIGGGLAMIMFPKTLLSWMTKPATLVSPLSINLMQWVGGVVLALTTPLLLAYPNTVAGILSRPTCYWTLGAGEVALVPIMLWQYLSGESAFDDKSLLLGAAALGGTLAYRTFVLSTKPEWVGIVKGSEKSA
jgi:hypothetical protein